MRVYNIEVYEIFDDAFISLTETMTSIRLERQQTTASMPEEIMTGIVATKGVFHAVIICEVLRELFEKIVYGLNLGDELSFEDQKQYMKEYLNVICGKALTGINNQMGNRSKLSVPHIVEGSYDIEEKQEFIEKLDFNYRCDHGRMKVSVYYKILPLYV